MARFGLLRHKLTFEGIFVKIISSLHRYSPLKCFYKQDFDQVDYFYRDTDLYHFVTRKKSDKITSSPQRRSNLGNFKCKYRRYLKIKKFFIIRNITIKSFRLKGFYRN